MSSTRPRAQRVARQVPAQRHPPGKHRDLKAVAGIL